MRLRRLDLIRYGKFTDHHLDFGEAAKREPDLHIVYGPNEAGKSTAFSGFLDLLYGIEPRSRFNFLHPYSTMRIGAVLDLADGRQELIRIKRPQNSLLDAREQPVPEGIFLGELGGIDRGSYRTMFSLDDETLEAGGESIVASQGELGELLFSASTGLAQLSRQLEGLRTESEEFYKYRGRDNLLAELKERLAKLQNERESLDTQAPHYAKLVENRNRTQLQYDAVLTERGRIYAHIEEMQRLLNALPLLSELRGLREMIKPLASLPEPPPGWTEEFPSLQKAEIELAVREQRLAEEIETLTAAFEAIVVDELILEQAEKLTALDGLRARYLTADDDLENRRIALRESELVIAGVLDRIDRKGEAEPGRLILRASVLGPLRSLIEARSGIDADLKSAQDELAEAHQRVDEAQRKLSEQIKGPEGLKDRKAQLAALEACVAELRMSDHAARRQLLATELADRRETVQDRLRALHPWRGEPQELADLPVPNSSLIETWKNVLSTAEKEVSRRRAAVEPLISERVHLEAELKAIEVTTGVVSDQEADRIRNARDKAWADHRRGLDPDSADQFEAALHEDDRITKGRLTHMGEIAKHNQASHRLILVEADQRRAEALEVEAKAELQKCHEEIAATLRRILPEMAEPLSLPKVESWLSLRTKALEEWNLLRTTERSLHRADADVDKARTKLTMVLMAACIPHENNASFDALLALAQTALDQESELIRLQQAVEERQSDLVTRERKAQKAVADKRAWAAEWDKACSACWLGATGVMPTIPVVREIMEALTGLGPAVENKTSLAHRVKAMEVDQAKFADALGEIAEALNIDSAKETPLELYSMISARIRKAQSAKAAQQAKKLELEHRQRRMKEHAVQQALHERRKSQLLAFFGSASLAEAGTALAGATKKAELQRQIDKAASALLDATGLPTLDEAEQALVQANRAGLTAELAELKERFEDQEQQCRDLYAELKKVQDQIEEVGGDDAVARIEEQRKTTLLLIEEEALRYVKLRIGIRAAEQALQLYRDRHRSSMMKQASDAFRTMSRGAYEGLATQPEKQSEVLIAICAGGGSKSVTDLSKGTRFQLYLALRVAGYHEFARLRPPVPFIADDIMETFDDFRAEEAVRLFADMATIGQVIYFTHHQHIVAIARRICPSARMHELP